MLALKIGWWLFTKVVCLLFMGVLAIPLAILNTCLSFFESQYQNASDAMKELIDV